MELTADPKNLFIETAQTLTGSDCCIFMAQVVKLLGKGGQRRAALELGWNRWTIRKGTHELESGIRCYDNFSGRGRKSIEKHLPNLLDDITVLRLSIDAKASVLVGPYSIGGRSLVTFKAVDHDFKTPFGILLHDLDELHITLTPSNVTSDFIVDCLQDFWGTANQRFPEVSTILINLDNGPENSSKSSVIIAPFHLRLYN